MENKIKKLEKISKYVRTKSLETILKAGNGHIGGNMSSVELLVSLYFGGEFNFDVENSKNENRDRVLIRGHEGPLRYTIFSLLGYINDKELDTYRTLGSRLQGHEDMHITPGVDITPSGSLGMLLSYGVGSCIANKNKNLSARTIVFLGDGEEQEGNICEAARHAASLKLNNMICILDKNKKQLSWETKNVDGESDIKKIWEGYGWDVLEIENGNDINQVCEVYSKLSSITKPTLIIANTTKGYGVKGALEHFSGYHTLSSVGDKNLVNESLEKMQKELEIEGIDFNSVKKIAKSMVIKPNIKSVTNDDEICDLFNIRTKKSGINVEQAEDDYLKELKRRIITAEKKVPFYFITPDLLRKDQADSLDISKFGNYYNIGIREQHAIAMAHGLSIENPEARIYVCYGDAFAYRSLDQVNAAASGKSNIMIVAEPSGIFQGKNGKTHQSVGQPLGVMSIPDINFFEPADSVDLYNVFSNILTNNKGVNYVRLHHGTLNLERNNSDQNNIGAYYIHQTDKIPKLVLLSCGFMGENAVKAAKALEYEYGIPTNVINVVSPKLLGEYLPKLLVNDAPIVTLYNGDPKILTKFVSEAILEDPYIPRPKFIDAHGFLEGTSGSVDDLIKYYGFDDEGIKKHVLSKSLKKRL